MKIGMSEMFRKGDRVKHSVKTDWGLGEVLEDQSNDKVRVIFEDVGVKTFSLKLASFTKVHGEEAHSPYLSSLVKAEVGGKKPNPARTKEHKEHYVHSFAGAVKKFLQCFPQGFQDPRYQKGPTNEREYKYKAHCYATDLLGREVLQTLLADAKYDEVCKRAKQVISKSNLIHPYETMWLSNGLATEGRRLLFAKELFYHLHDKADLDARFGRFVKMLYDIGAAKWTIATYFLFLTSPAEYIFVKPEVTKRAAEALGADIGYTPAVNWPTYKRILDFAETLKGKLSAEGRDELTPRDMIDVHSFIWIIGPSYAVESNVPAGGASQ